MKRTPAGEPYDRIVYIVKQYTRPPYERRWEVGVTTKHGPFVNANDARAVRKALVIAPDQPRASIRKLWMRGDTQVYETILTR
jgi:hypothetical protein